jgi:hypothetical protein
MAFAFDTLAYVRRLRDGGIPAQAAEVHADAAREFIMTEVATRSDLEVLRRELETSFSHRFDLLEASISSNVERLEASISSNVQRLEASISSNVQRLEASDTSLREDMKEGFLSVRRDMASALKNVEDRMTVKMGFMFATAIGILAAIIKL